jgi:hypothetical protein
MAELISGRPITRRGRNLTMADAYLDNGRAWEAASEAERDACRRDQAARLARIEAEHAEVKRRFLIGSK